MWILVIILIVSGTPCIHSVEFNTMDKCSAAAHELNENGTSINVITYCMEK